MCALPPFSKNAFLKRQPKIKIHPDKLAKKTASPVAENDHRLAVTFVGRGAVTVFPWRTRSASKQCLPFQRLP